MSGKFLRPDPLVVCFMSDPADKSPSILRNPFSAFRRRRSRSTNPEIEKSKKESEQVPLRSLISRSPKYRVQGGLRSIELLSPVNESPLHAVTESTNVLSASLDERSFFETRRRSEPPELKKEKISPLANVPKVLQVNTMQIRPGFRKHGSTLKNSLQRVDQEVGEIQHFIQIIPSLMEDGVMIPSDIKKKLKLFFGSLEQTDRNITLLLGSLLEKDEEVEIETFIELSERIKKTLLQYQEIKNQYELEEMDADEFSARQLVSTLSKLELRELLAHSDLACEEENTREHLQNRIIQEGLLSCMDGSEDTDDEEFEFMEDLGEKRECVICCEDHHDRNFRSLSCGHAYCKYCLKVYIETKVNDGAVQEMICPFPTCCAEYTAKDVADLVSVITASRYDQLRILADLNQNPNCRWCPRPGCNTAMIANPLIPKLTCSRCQQEICFDCKIEAHHGISCKEYAEERKDPAEDEGWTRWTKENKAKACPKCGVWIIRPTGCNQVICKNCQYSFCWLCMQFCIVPDHFKSGECEGKWFEDTNLSTGEKIVAGIVLGGVIVLASPIIAFAGTIALGRKLKRKVTKPKNLDWLEDDSDTSRDESL